MLLSFPKKRARRATLSRCISISAAILSSSPIRRGLRETGNKIEQEGIRRAEKVAQESDILLALFDGTLPEKDAENAENSPAKRHWWCIPNPTLVKTKKRRALRFVHHRRGNRRPLETLTAKVTQAFKFKPGPVLTRERHRAALKDTATALERCLGTLQPELAAEDLRLALRSLGSVTGRVHVEENP